MKYKEIQIYHSILSNKYIYAISNYEGEILKTSPSKQGFFAYPETVSDEVAFNVLKDFLIKNGIEEIAKLENKIKMLKELQYEKKEN